MKSMRLYITNNGSYIATKTDEGYILNMAKVDMLVDKYGNTSINCLLLGDNINMFEGCIAVIELSSNSLYFKAYKNMLDNIK